MPLTAKEAFDRLREGNRRFVSDLRSLEALRSSLRRSDLLSGQSPFAVVLGCSDSRVPAEIVFDQGLGDLFVVRVAGNIVAPSLVGSVEFAVERFGTPLVVVLGHSQCGAILATLDSLESPSRAASLNIDSIVARIRPSVQALLDARSSWERKDLLAQAVRANVRASAEHLRHGSAVLERFRAEGNLVVLGAEYSLETGGIDFFDGLPESW